MVIILVGIFQFAGAFGFVLGFFLGIEWLMLLGGVMVVADDLREIDTGLLNPVLPALLAVAGALVFSPWYVGIFWASALFKVLSQPARRRNLFAAPEKVLAIRLTR